MASRAAYAAGAAALDQFAQWMMRRQEKKEARKENAEAEESFFKRKIAEEDRIAGKTAMEPVERKLYEVPSEDGRPPLLMVDKLNKYGETIAQELPSQREIKEYESRRLQEQEAAKLAAEERAFKERPEFKDGFWVDRKAGTVKPEQTYLEQQVRERAAGRTNVTVNGDGTPPTGFEKALDKKDADYYDSLRTAATGATATLDNLRVLEGILEGTKTGKTQELLAQAGQYFGTDLGTDMQTFNVAAKPLFLSMVDQMPGALSDKDRQVLEQASPGFGLDPKANQVVIGILRTAANRAKSTYAEADKYATENRGLRGFVPTSAKASKPAEEKKPAEKYTVGKVLDIGGKRYRVVPGGTPEDPELEEI